MNDPGDDIILMTRNLKKSYMQGKIPVHALQGVGIKVKRSELISIVGPSGSGKSTMLSNPDDLVKIAMEHRKHEGRAILTRVLDKQLKALQQKHPVEWNRYAKTAILRKEGFKVEMTGGSIGIITAGTVDIPVAEEAKIIAGEMGVTVHSIYDVGAAGIHRLFGPVREMIETGVDAVVVAAGREGTLPTIVSGIVDVPVIGVPVSSGYGAGGDGIAALYSMLQSCSILAVVNINAGFTAGAYAARIANMLAWERKKKIEQQY